MAYPHSQTKLPKKNSNFKPLPECLKPNDRLGHRVHLTKTEIEGEVLPEHQDAINSGKGFYNARNGGVNYYRTLPYMPATMSASKGDLRSRSESPRRARAAREKYWSYRHVNPHTQRDAFHLDLNPPTDKDGNKRYWSELVPVLPAEARAVIPTKRQLYKQAQEWPRPPRRHRASHERRAGMDNPRRKDELQFIADDESWRVQVHGHPPRKSKVEGAKRTWNPRPVSCFTGKGYQNLSEARWLPEMLEMSYDDALLCDWWVDTEYKPPWASWPDLHGQLYNEDGEVEPESTQAQDADALFDMAEQKHAFKVAAKRKKLQKQGWDVWDGESVLSPELDWEDVHEDDDEEFEML